MNRQIIKDLTNAVSVLRNHILTGVVYRECCTCRDRMFTPVTELVVTYRKLGNQLIKKFAWLDNVDIALTVGQCGQVNDIIDQQVHMRSSENSRKNCTKQYYCHHSLSRSHTAMCHQSSTTSIKLPRVYDIGPTRYRDVVIRDANNCYVVTMTRQVCGGRIFKTGLNRQVKAFQTMSDNDGRVRQSDYICRAIIYSNPD